MGKLTHKGVQSLSKPGMHGDGDGLWLRVSQTGSKSWILRTAVHGRRKEFGLGSLKWVSLAEAREAARELRKVARQGGSPETMRMRQNLTLRDAAQRVHAAQLPTWKNRKHAAAWLQSLETYVLASLGDRAIETIGSAEILQVMGPIWTSKPETARRVLQRLHQIFDWAKTAGYYGAENPAAGVKRALPKVDRTQKHMAALPWQEMPAFFAKLDALEATAARMVQFAILTAARSGEARGAVWDEISQEAWIIPADRMKRNREHRVPLSDAALGVLDRVRCLHLELVFPSPQRRTGEASDKILSENAGSALLKRMGYEGITLHGFRSTFRDWCAESAHADREVAEAALSHATGNAVEQAYARSDLFDRRKELMAAWARYCIGETGSVVELVRGR